jgi:hypothetical protein
MIASSNKRTDRNSDSTPRRHNRKEILEIAQSMAHELVARAEAAASHDEAQAFLRSAQLMRELVGIADGRRSSAYWTRRPRTAKQGPALPTALTRLQRLGARLPGSLRDGALVA